VERATRLLLDIVGGEAGEVVEVRNEADLPRRTPVNLRAERLHRLLGIELPVATVTGMFERLGFEVEEQADGWSVTPTAARFDIEIEEDLIEEVVRLHGYDNVPEVRQRSEVTLAPSTEGRMSTARVSTLLADLGYQEIISYSFVDPERQAELLGEGAELELANPLSSEQSVMRRSLWPGLLTALEANRKRQQERVRLFEHGVIFESQSNEIQEKDFIAGLAWGSIRPEHWDDPKRVTDLFDIKSSIESLAVLAGIQGGFQFSVAEHPALRPGRTARIDRDGEPVGWIGELHPKIVRKRNLGQTPILFELAVAEALTAGVPAYAEISRFPSVRRDFAVLISEDVSAADLMATVREAAGELCRDVRIFDVYTGEGIEKGLKSVALGLILQETSRTLTELEIERVSNAVVEQISSKFNASIRE
jgi:phenylalanyl-tRNA synthetase beta chain